MQLHNEGSQGHAKDNVVLFPVSPAPVDEAPGHPSQSGIISKWVAESLRDLDAATWKVRYLEEKKRTARLVRRSGMLVWAAVISGSTALVSAVACLLKTLM